MRSGMPLLFMAWYSNFADYIGEQLKTLQAAINEAQQKKEAKQAELVPLGKEIRTIEDLREEQYHAYLEEVSKEEERILGDLISYNMSTETAE
jgi:flagellar export protein FliJ